MPWAPGLAAPTGDPTAPRRTWRYRALKIVMSDGTSVMIMKTGM